jgi:hypothetical protein
MKSTTALPSFTESDHFTTKSTILRIYELFVRTTYEGPSLNVRDDNKTDGLSREVLTYLDDFTRAVKEHGAKILILRETSRHFTKHELVRTFFSVNAFEN